MRQLISKREHMSAQANQPMTRNEAKTQGFKRYFPGVPCKKGHLVERYVCDNKCVECARLALLDRYANNREKELLRSKEYRTKNADLVNERNRVALREKRKNSPEVMRSYDKTKYLKIRNDPVLLEKERARQRDKQKRAYLKDPEKLKERAKRSRTATPERIEATRQSCREYKRRNPEVIRQLNLKHNHLDRAARLQRVPRWLTDEEIVKIRQLYEEARSKGLQVDHIIPLQGKMVSGLHVYSNLQLLTRSENASKKNTYVIS